MKHELGVNDSPCKVISLKNYKDKKVKNVSSTLAAIIAINIEHPSDTTPEDYFVSEIEAIEGIEILALENALENNSADLSSIGAKNNALNDA